MVDTIQSSLGQVQKSQPQQTYAHLLLYAMNQQRITGHLGWNGTDENLTGRVEINYILTNVIPIDHGSTSPKSLRKLEEQRSGES